MTRNEKPTDFDFAAGLAELEEITAWFESSDVDLTVALSKFERGMELAASLKDHLQIIENRVVKIKQRFDTPVAMVAKDEEQTAAEVEPMDLFGAE